MSVIAFQASIGFLRFLVLLLLLAPVQSLSVLMPEPLMQVRIDFGSASEYERFLQIRDISLMRLEPGAMAMVAVTADQLEELHALGFRPEVQIDHLQEFYASRIRGDNFGAIHTFSETEEFLDDLHASCPTITTAKRSIGTSHEGRDIWAFKISDNPEIDETEPEVLFDGLHHACEPMSLEVTLHCMAWLCENYGSDPLATYLVDNREIWFVPLMNPDGYVYNELTYPNGGGMWRKNRRDNGDGTWGVDPNRNYPYEWGGAGASEQPGSCIYRGPYPASEPEVQALMNLMLNHDFVAHLTMHSCLGGVVIPWCHSTERTPDDERIGRWADGMTKYNGYLVLKPGENMYLCSGTTTDYAYGEQEEKNRIMSCILEVGGSFWPHESTIPGINEDCLWPQLYTACAAGLYLEIIDYSLSGDDGDAYPDPGETLDLMLTVQNHSLFEDAANVALVLTSDDAYIQIHGAIISLNTIAAGETSTSSAQPFSFTIDPSTPEHHILSMTAALSAADFGTERIFDWLVAILWDDLERGCDNWLENDGTWGLVNWTSHSPANSYTESPHGWYHNNANSWIELVRPLDLSQTSEVNLSFWHHYSTEAGHDFCHVEVSPDAGSTWNQIGPEFHGVLQNWEQVELSLAEYVGVADVKVRFRLESDASGRGDGWYIDDVLVAPPPIPNTPPTAPTLSSPEDGSVLDDIPPTLIVYNSFDADPGDVLTYGFVVYSDEHYCDVVASASGVHEGRITTMWPVDVALEGGEYWWRAYAYDGKRRSSLMSGSSFVLGMVPADAKPTTQLFLHPIHPNPSSDKFLLTLDLPTLARTRLGIYDVQGRLVRTLLNGMVGPGQRRLIWDGQDEDGHNVATGLYMMQLKVNDQVVIRPLTLLR